MLLYDSPASGNCYKVRLLLAQLGLPYERLTVDVVDRSGREELLGELNPGLRVPTVVLDDGRPLGESNAILCYFAEGTPYLPDDRFERAQVLQWLFYEQYSHEPYIAVLRFWLHSRARRPARARSGTSAPAARRPCGRWSAILRDERSWWARATQSPTPRSTPTPTSPRRPAWTWEHTRRWGAGSLASRSNLGTWRSTTEDRGPVASRRHSSGAPR